MRRGRPTCRPGGHTGPPVHTFTPREAVSAGPVLVRSPSSVPSPRSALRLRAASGRDDHGQHLGRRTVVGAVCARTPDPLRWFTSLLLRAQTQHVLQRMISFVTRVFENSIPLVPVQRKRHCPGTGLHVRIIDCGVVLNRVFVNAREAFDDVSGLALRNASQPTRCGIGRRSLPCRIGPDTPMTRESTRTRWPTQRASRRWPWRRDA